jgi:hypothetical protein
VSGVKNATNPNSKDDISFELLYRCGWEALKTFICRAGSLSPWGVGVKRAGCGVDHPPTSKAEVEERVQLYICSPSGPSWPVLGWPLPLPLRTIHRKNESPLWKPTQNTHMSGRFSVFFFMTTARKQIGTDSKTPRTKRDVRFPGCDVRPKLRQVSNKMQTI